MNLDSYIAIAEQWEQHRVQLSPLEAKVLLILIEDLAPSSTLLDLGCGTGQPVAAFFADMGFHMRARQRARGAGRGCEVTLAKLRHPNATI